MKWNDWPPPTSSLKRRGRGRDGGFAFLHAINHQVTNFPPTVEKSLEKPIAPNFLLLYTYGYECHVVFRFGATTRNPVYHHCRYQTFPQLPSPVPPPQSPVHLQPLPPSPFSANSIHPSKINHLALDHPFPPLRSLPPGHALQITSSTSFLPPFSVTLEKLSSNATGPRPTSFSGSPYATLLVNKAPCLMCSLPTNSKSDANAAIFSAIKTSHLAANRRSYATNGLRMGAFLTPPPLLPQRQGHHHHNPHTQLRLNERPS